MLALALALWSSSAEGSVRLDRSSQPVRVGTDPTGLPIYAFGSRAVWPVLPAAVVRVADGGMPPVGAEPLGGPFWRVDAEGGEDGVALAFGVLNTPGVLDAFPDVLLPLKTADFDDPQHGGQWYLEDLEMDALYAVSLGDPSVTIAVIDSGIDVLHPDLAPGLVGQKDVYDDDDDPSPDAGEFCHGAGTEVCDTHGTAVSGIATARANNGVGIVGLCPECTLVAIKLLGEDATPSSTVVAAFEYAIERNAAVINNSWGYVDATSAPSVIADAIERARTVPREGLGALVVFAAGNDDRTLEDDELTGLDGVLCVSAVDTYGNSTNYTNYGPSVDVAAPSATVSIAPNGGITETFGGTSAAAPVASGLAGWVASVAPTLTADEIGALLIDTAWQSPLIDFGEDGHHDVFGYGTVSPPALLLALFPDTADDPPAPDDDGVEPGGCGCGASPGLPSAIVWLLWPLVRRKRAALGARGEP